LVDKQNLFNPDWSGKFFLFQKKEIIFSQLQEVSIFFFFLGQGKKKKVEIFHA